jgi:hypothetical protein
MEIKIPELLPHPSGSTTVEGQGYDNANRMLFIKFQNTGLYAYHDFDNGKYKKFLESESPGKYVHKEIIPVHAHEKIKPGQETLKK